MYIGILYNTFVCFIIGVTSLAVFLLLQKSREEKEKKYSQGLDYFSLLLGLLWLFVGIRTFFVWRNSLNLDTFIFKWFTGPLTYIHLIPLFYYFGWSFFKGKKLRFFFNALFTLVTLLVVFTFFKYGFEPGEVTYWGTDPAPHKLTNKLFIYCLFLPALLFIIIEFIRRLRNWRRTKDLTERQLFGFTIGFLIYAITGILDALGGIQSWLILLIRIGVMLAPLTFYLSATFGAEK